MIAMVAFVAICCLLHRLRCARSFIGSFLSKDLLHSHVYSRAGNHLGRKPGHNMERTRPIHLDPGATYDLAAQLIHAANRVAEETGTVQP